MAKGKQNDWNRNAQSSKIRIENNDKSKHTGNTGTGKRRVWKT
jgi:hypothetical protein